MSKHRKLRGPVARFVSSLPVRYRSRAAAVVGALGVVVSVAAIIYADKPEVALMIHIATALGLVDGHDSDQ